MVRQKAKAIQLTKCLLYARRNGHIKKEQIAYKKLASWANNNGYDIGQILETCTNYLRKNSIAANMNGLI